MTTQTALALPDETQFRQDIQAINRFQAIVHQNLVVNQDYGVIPGTTKPTLLKPGAEKIAKLLGLSDQYEIIDRQEDWNKPFFRYLVKCKLIHVATQSLISEGLGECNSMESKYRWRWLSERDLPVGIDRSKLIAQERTAKTGGHWTVFRFENDDIYSQVNTILKMSKKRALVDAALSAGRLSNVFTQDMEDLPAEEMTEGTISSAVQERRTVDKSEHYCELHGVNYFLKGKMKAWAHPVKDENGKDTGEWCHEHKEEPRPAPQHLPEPPESTTEASKEEASPINLDWLKENMVILQGKGLKAWTNANVLSYLNTITGKEATKVSEAVKNLSKEQADAFASKIQETVEVS